MGAGSPRHADCMRSRLHTHVHTRAADTLASRSRRSSRELGLGLGFVLSSLFPPLFTFASLFPAPFVPRLWPASRGVGGIKNKNGRPLLLFFYFFLFSVIIVSFFFHSPCAVFPLFSSARSFFIYLSRRRATPRRGPCLFERTAKKGKKKEKKTRSGREITTRPTSGRPAGASGSVHF